MDPLLHTRDEGTVKTMDFTGSTWMTSNLDDNPNEHKNHINHNTTQHSIITDHGLDTSHEFYWINIKILDEEKILQKKLLFKMSHIKQQNNELKL